MIGNDHSFSRTVAKEHGVKQAILLKYMVHRIRHSNKVREGKKWYYDSAEALARRFPFLGGKSTVNKLLNDLVKADILERGRFNKKGYDKTSWYTVANEAIADASGENLVYFSPNDAQEHGIVAAVLLQNLRHWIQKNRQEVDPGYCYHKMSPYKLENLLPFPKTSIARALEGLVRKGLLKCKPVILENAQEYAFIREADLIPFQG